MSFARSKLKSLRAVAFCFITSVILTLAPAQAAPHILVDLETGRILDQKDALTPWYPASLTKLMTAFVTFEAISAGEITMRSAVRVSKNALSQAPSKMGFRVGTEVTVENALKMVIVKSANDIAVALGEAVGGSESNFVARMNKAAAKLGMTGTRFKNPNGLPAKGQTTNARDMAVLTQAIMKRYPQHRDLFKITAIKAGKRTLRSYNPLLTRYKGATGMKTGFICASGFNLVATAKRKNKHLIAVVLGSPSSQERAESAAGLLNKGFKPFTLKGRKNVKDIKASGGFVEPVNLRPLICSQKARSDKAKRLKGYKMGEGKSLLSKNLLVSVKPVVVRTGGAVRSIAANLRNAPTPIPRPNAQIAAALQSGDDAKALEAKISADAVDTGDGDGDQNTISETRTLGGIPIPLTRPAFAKVTGGSKSNDVDEKVAEEGADG
ncbi:MAG: D-alanyl-D-alanine carboxypeptidase family protein [Hyphomicrobiales bacterium]